MNRSLIFIIEMATPRADREWVVGDTIEEFATIEQSAGPAAARRWLRSEVRRVMLSAPRHRMAVLGRGTNSATGHAGTVRTAPLHRSRRLATIGSELHNALRGLRAGRATTALAFTILTLTMAAGTITFSVVDGLAFRPLPYGDPAALVSLASPSPGAGRFRAAIPQDYFAWLEATQSFESLGAASFVASRELQVDGTFETLITKGITSNLFDVLRVPPAAGRFFGPEHEQPGGPADVILSHDVWLRKFRLDPAVIGRQLTIGQEVREVIGVLPEGVSFPITTGPPTDLYIPYIPAARDRAVDGPRRSTLSSIVGRLRPGVTVEQASADANRISAAEVVPLHDQVVGPQKTWLFMMLAAVGFVLLGGCVNVASLLLTRATTRAHELATREALGASRRRLAGTLLLEGLILSVSSATAGIILSFWGVEVAKSILPSDLARVSSISIDGRVLSVSIAVSIVCGLLFASAPAWLAARSNLIGLMKSSGGAIIGGGRRDRSLSGFLVGEIAFVCMLLVATTLVVTSFILITTMDLGFDRQNVMTLSYMRSLENVPERDRSATATTLRNDLIERARAVPGVTHVAFSINASGPLSPGVRYSLEIPGLGETPREDMLETNMVTPDYFDAMGMQLLRGRLFEATDRAGTNLVMVVNDAAARKFFPDRDPVGQVVTFRGPTTIVGILKSVRFDGPEEDVRPAMYIPVDQEPYSGAYNAMGSLVIRTTQDPRPIAPAVQAALRPALASLQLHSRFPEPDHVRFVDDLFVRMTATRRFNAGLMAAFGFIAIALGAIGVYGTMAFFVARQVRAIGLRMALGASSSRVMRSVLGAAVGRVALGTAIGLAGAWAISSAFTSFVFGIQPTDVRVYAGVGLLIAVIGFAAAFMPALRAARLDPLSALRED